MKHLKQILLLFLVSIILLSTVCVSADITFNLSGTIDSKLPFVKSDISSPFTARSGVYDKQPYMNADSLSLNPKLYIKFNEGEGNTVKDYANNKSYSITGSDYKWINDADIRYGNELFNPIKQKSALKLNSSYIDLGEVDALKDIKGDFTVAFWTNHEIHGRNTDYVEEGYQTTLSAGSYRQAYKYNKGIHYLMLQSDSAKLGAAGEGFGLDYGTGGVYKSHFGSNPNNDYYNLYFAVVRKNDAGKWVLETYSNDKPESAGTGSVIINKVTYKELTDWSEDKAIFNGNLYVGSPDGSSMPLGLAELMVFDHALTYRERLELYYGYKQLSFYMPNIPSFEN